MTSSLRNEQKPVRTRPEVEEAVNKLIHANRARCLWFASLDYLPVTDAERLRALQHVERHGDRRAFVRARELSGWVLQLSSER